MKVGLRSLVPCGLAAAVLLFPATASARPADPVSVPGRASASAMVLSDRNAQLLSSNHALASRLSVEKAKNAVLSRKVSFLNKELRDLRAQVAHLLGLVADLRFQLTVSYGPWRSARASTYGIGDGLMGSGLAGAGHLDAVRPVFAHRSMPFGTKVQFTYQGRSIIGECQDRGPYVGGRDFDLGPKIANSLGFGGVSGVKWRVVRHK
jgi:rare lipoprotein A (peptidoglycan hydrolase)